MLKGRVFVVVVENNCTTFSLNTVFVEGDRVRASPLAGFLTIITSFPMLSPGLSGNGFRFLLLYFHVVVLA